ncbi:MAG: RdgB/HAM1 family non-canonical purine NTP pyrophosphatase [Bdellovibrionota bacterium]
MTELWFASGNQGKTNEMKMLLNRLISSGKLALHTQNELKVFSQPPENGDSFTANARIKARALKSVKTGVWVVAEDSGLMVDGLGGIPGIHSARYAGPKASDGENTAKLLKMMTIRPMENRNASFISAIVAFDPQGKEYVFEGKMEGEIAKASRGTQGFGYDSVFIPVGETKTLAELGTAFKNKISHRAKAVTQFMEVLEQGLEAHA